jgi:hypothetical protein
LEKAKLFSNYFRLVQSVGFGKGKKKAAKIGLAALFSGCKIFI